MNIAFTKEIRPTVHSIILADDDLDDQFFFREALSDVDRSVQLKIAKNGKELLELLDSQKADIIFLDLNMPVTNGFQYLKKIRNNPVYHHTPIVIFSSTCHSIAIETAYHLGAHLFFVKPFNYTDLKAALKTILTLDWKNPQQIKEQFAGHDNLGAFVV